MSEHIEIEAKAMIDRKGYQKLTKNLSSFTLINYYIDTPNFDVSKNHMGCRIRLTNDKYELTVKVDLDEGRREINQDIGKSAFEDFIWLNDFPDGPVKNALAAHGIKIKDLKIFSFLKTTRTDICYKGSLIEIDKSEYNKQEDYEVECEDSSMKIALRNLKDFLKENGVNYSLNTVTKLKRVMDSL